MWAPGQVPPAWAATAIDAGAADSEASRNSQAALFERAERGREQDRLRRLASLPVATASRA